MKCRNPDWGLSITNSIPILLPRSQERSRSQLLDPHHEKEATQTPLSNLQKTAYPQSLSSLLFIKSIPSQQFELISMVKMIKFEQHLFYQLIQKLKVFCASKEQRQKPSFFNAWITNRQLNFFLLRQKKSVHKRKKKLK